MGGSVLAAYLMGCAGPKGRQAAKPQDPTPAPLATPAETSGVDIGALNREVNPCDDFYRFACGGWIASAEIPPDRPAWFRSFSVINERTQAQLKATLESLASGSEDATDRKLGDFYAACMDEAQSGGASAEVLNALLQRIEAMADNSDLASLVADLQLQGVDALFTFGAIQDFKDAQQMIGGADQGGLGLPDRDYYLKKDPASRKILRAYQRHVEAMLRLVGRSPSTAAAQARKIVGLETQLAKSSMDKVLRRQPEKIYNRLNRTGLVALAPAFDWLRYFATLGRPHVEAINVMSPDFFKGLQVVLTKRPLSDLKLYLQWRVLDESAPALAEAFVDEAFKFRQVLTGEEALLPRWKRCLEATEEAMGQALGRSFVQKTFSPSAKDRSLEMVRAIERSFGRNLEELAWMDAPTRAGAREKLDRVYNKIGYPDKWRSYEALTVDRKSDLANRFAAAAFEARRDLAKIGEPIDRSEWHMSPQTVNAYYDALMNEMVFPAGILQPPFFDVTRSVSANFGAAGMVMGHELTHGFDDEGRKFDAQGNLRDWWSEEAAQQFEARTKCVEKQYGGFEIAPNLPVNGALTLGENIADIGGLELAYSAWKNERAQALKDPAPTDRDGFTPEQGFFIAFAQSWCAKRREPYAKMMLTIDPHAPPEFRVNGPVMNTPSFQKAFGCPSGSPMAPQLRCEVW